MDNAKTLMMAASVLGAAFGAFYASTLKLIENGLLIGVLFAFVGVGLANLVLLLIYELSKRYGRVDSASETSENQQPIAVETQNSFEGQYFLY